MEASKPKLINSILNIIGVNSLRLRGLCIFLKILIKLLIRFRKKIIWRPPRKSGLTAKTIEAIE